MIIVRHVLLTKSLGNYIGLCTTYLVLKREIIFTFYKLGKLTSRIEKNVRYNYLIVMSLVVLTSVVKSLKCDIIVSPLCTSHFPCLQTFWAPKNIVSIVFLV